MNNEDKNNKSLKKYKDLLDKVDNTEFVSDEQMKEMDFFELAYYLQTLNQVKETFVSSNEKEND